jgi:hypothetical protein
MGRLIGLGLGAALLFGAVAALLVRILPQPMRPVDYLVAGVVATMVSLLALFLAVIVTSKQKNVFFRRRRPPE